MVTVRVVPFDAPDARGLAAAALADLTARYGGEGDGNVISAADFRPPDGAFLVAYVDSTPAGCGGWRTLAGDPYVAEIKRMYTAPQFRGRGVALAVLAALEDSARAAGRKRAVLETGPAQPEAIALYQRCGYRPVPGFGFYRCHADAMSLGRDLT